MFTAIDFIQCSVDNDIAELDFAVTYYVLFFNYVSTMVILWMIHNLVFTKAKVDHRNTFGVYLVVDTTEMRVCSLHMHRL